MTRDEALNAAAEVLLQATRRPVKADNRAKTARKRPAAA